MPHEGEVVVASLYPLGCTPKGQTRNILIHSQAAELSMASTGVHSVHSVYTVVQRPHSTQKWGEFVHYVHSFHTACVKGVSPRLHTKFNLFNRERRLKKNS